MWSTLFAAIAVIVAAWAVIVSLMRRRPVITVADNGWYVCNANTNYPIVLERVFNESNLAFILYDGDREIRIPPHQETKIDVFVGPTQTRLIAGRYW